MREREELVERAVSDQPAAQARRRGHQGRGAQVDPARHTGEGGERRGSAGGKQKGSAQAAVPCRTAMPAGGRPIDALRTRRGV